MARVAQRRISWTPASDSDLVAHRVYIEESPTTPTYNSNYIEVPMPTTEAIAPTDFPSGTFDVDTEYNIGISAVDDLGNESDIVVVSAPFDFIAPGVPTNITIEPILG